MSVLACRRHPARPSQNAQATALAGCRPQSTAPPCGPSQPPRYRDHVTNWGKWTEAPPLPEPEAPVTADSCEIRSRITWEGNYWDAPAITYRVHPKTPAQGIARLAPWARPFGAQTWTCAATLGEMNPTRSVDRFHSA